MTCGCGASLAEDPVVEMSGPVEVSGSVIETIRVLSGEICGGGESYMVVNLGFATSGLDGASNFKFQFKIRDSRNLRNTL